MSDLFDKIVAGVNPSADTETEWFTVPTNHSYTGTIRFSHVGSSGTGACVFGLTECSATGSVVYASEM